MGLFKNLIVAVTSSALALSAFSGISSVSAEEIAYETVSPNVYSSDTYLSDVTDSDPSEIVVTEAVTDPVSDVTTTTTVNAEPIVIPAVTSDSGDDDVIVTDVPAFNVFDIYDAHLKYVASTTVTTTVPTTTTTTTTAFPKVDASKGIKGIDVSKWQGDINWNNVKSDGIDYAIIRAGYGKLASQKDPKFDANMVNAQKAGLKRGVYWYSYATTVEEAYQEAEACYAVIKDYNFEYPLCFDIEEDAQRNLSTATVSAIIDAFCSTMSQKGYYVSIYSYASFLNTKVYSNVLKKYDVWVAHFNVSAPNYSLPYGIWQYSSTGSVKGINGNVDMDYSYKDYPTIITTKHKNGY